MIGNDGKICFDMILKSDITRRKFARNSSFNNMPPRPLASNCHITDAALNFFSLRYNDNHALDNFMETYRNNKLLSLAKYFELHHPAIEIAASLSHSSFFITRSCLGGVLVKRCRFMRMTSAPQISSSFRRRKWNSMQRNAQEKSLLFGKA